MAFLLVLGCVPSAQAQSAPESEPAPATPEEFPAEPAVIVTQPPWWTGKPLSDVLISAPLGGLPDETLEPLLRATEGKPFDAQTVALDLVTLFQIGEFSAVDADVQPWVGFDDQGEPVAGVLLTYVVYPAPKIAKVSVQGNRRIRGRSLLDAVGLGVGQKFFADQDGPFARERLLRWLNREGYPDAHVEVRSTQPEPGEVHVAVLVEEGEPNTLVQLDFTGNIDDVVSEQQLRRWARREGVALGKPLTPDALIRSQSTIREHLGSVRRTLFDKPRGLIGARITAAVVDATGGTGVTYAIERGPKLELEVLGMPYGGRRIVVKALGIDHRLRVTRGFVDLAPERLVKGLRERGWWTATATVRSVTPSPDVQRLIVDVNLGPKHAIGDRRPDLVFVDFDFAFDPALTTRRERRQEQKALQAVFDQASPDLLRRDVYTPEAMAVGLEAARLFYVDRGHLDAVITSVPPKITARRSLDNLWRTTAGLDARMRIRPQVQVAPGPVTRLTGLSWEGMAEEVDANVLEAARASALDQPYSPQRIDAAARAVVGLHQTEGYLSADAKVVQEEVVKGERSVRIVVDPGQRILLRSVVTRGTRITPSSYVQNLVDLQLGQPVTSTDLERVRSRLYQLGIFQSVSIELIGDESARDLLLTVAERKRWAFEIAPGLSTDQGMRAYGRAVRRNLFGRAHQIEFLGQIGFEFRSQNVQDWLLDFSDPEWRAAAQYTAPRFPTKRQELVLDVVLRERRQERTWEMDRTGGGAAIETVIKRTRLRVGSRIETRQINELDIGALLPGEPWTQAPFIDIRFPELPSPWRVQESLTALVVHDRRDNPLQPTRGGLFSLNTEWVPGFGWDRLRDQGRTAFLKNEARVSGFFPISGLTLHIAGGAGYIESFAGVAPLEDRFRLGGTGSMRGFVRDAVGPHNIAPPLQVIWPDGIGPVIDYVSRNAPSRWTPTGGDTTANAVFELLMPLPALGLTGWDGYAAELFVDAGNVWLLNPTVTATSELSQYQRFLPAIRYAVGAGLQVQTPIGPLQVDLAMNPQAAFANGPTRSLLVGGWREPVFRAHLTLGAVW